jgi:hypothetical protein
MPVDFLKIMEALVQSFRNIHFVSDFEWIKKQNVANILDRLFLSSEDMTTICLPYHNQQGCL